MNSQKFTLVHRGSLPAKLAKSTIERIEQTLPSLKDAFARFKPAQQKLKSVLAAEMSNLSAEHISAAAAKIETIRAELERQQKTISVGVWDIGARVAWLSKLIEHLNAAQPAFVFFEVEAGIPSGLISQPERVIAWAKDALGKNWKSSYRKDMESNVIANDFFPRADKVRADLGLDYIVGVTPGMVAGEEDDGNVYWNHFSTFEKRSILVSVQDLRAFAKKAGRPFEALVGHVTIAQLLVAQSYSRGLSFHEDRGCLFDYNESRESIVTAAQHPNIEPACLKLIAPSIRESALKLAEALNTFIV